MSGQKISFEASAGDLDLVSLIGKRAVDTGLVSPCARRRLEMDLVVTHANGCPLDLARLLAAPRFDFSHDVMEITAHLDRETGELTRCFLPRYSKRRQDVG